MMSFYHLQENIVTLITVQKEVCLDLLEKEELAVGGGQRETHRDRWQLQVLLTKREIKVWRRSFPSR